MPRFFINQDNIIASDTIKITGDDVNHIKRVLRLRPGEMVTVCDGRGTDYLVRIDKLDQDFIETGIIESYPVKTESQLDVTLFQGMPKSDKMDFIIQKSVELGVRKIVPVLTERTVVRIDNKKDAENKVSRWQRIALEAAKQCNRGMIPEIGLPVDFQKALEIAGEAQLGIIPYEKESERCLKNCLNNHINSVAVFIGPEGGFSENEILKAVDCGVKPVTLGPRILRTETAGIVVLSILMYELGDVGI